MAATAERNSVVLPRRSTGLRLPNTRTSILAMLLLAGLLLAACGGNGEEVERTPVPTWTSTPMGALPVAPANAPAEAPVAAATLPPAEPIVATVASAPPTAVVIADTPTADPALVTATPIPTATPTPVATPTPAPPTDTPTPVPTATPDFAFVLEEATQFPTVSLASNVVRIWLYVYSPSDLALGDYTMRVSHNGVPLTVDEVTTAGVPEQTRAEPGPFTRFTNMNVLFIEPQAGIWEVQLLDATGQPAGPNAVFQVAEEQLERELYVRYKQVRPR